MNDENATSSASPRGDGSTDSSNTGESGRKGGAGPLAARFLRKEPPARDSVTKETGIGETGNEPAPAGPQLMISAEQWIEAETAPGSAKKEHSQQKSTQQESRSKGHRRKDRDRDRDKDKDKEDDGSKIVEAPRPPKVSVPLRRGPLDDDLQRDLDLALGGTNLDQLLSGPVGGQGELSEGDRVRGTVIKLHQDFVFVSLGGPHEGMAPLLQFESPPEPGSVIEVLIRKFSPEDGLYILVVPGKTIQADDWSDLQEGSIVDCTVTGFNSGGLEVKVGNVSGFIPAGQVAEHRVEDFQEYVNQRMTCVITEASERRGRLILSRRAVLERERQERRQAQLEQIQPGDTMEGTVRSIKDFGAFVDLGGLEGLLHISKLSWDKIQHPSEVLQEGQKVRVKIEKIEKPSGKISLSYRDLLESPWDTIEREHPVGSHVRGKVTRIANYGAFVKIATGIEGLIHVSELAHHRVFKVENVVKEGDEVEVKVLSIDREAQKVGLSLKATQAKPEPKSDSGQAKAEVEEPPRQPAIKRQHQGPLRGGTDRSSGAGEAFGLKW